MKLVFTRRAGRDLDAIATHVKAAHAAAAEAVGRSIEKSIDLITAFPEAGRATDRPGIRQLVSQPYGYLIYDRHHPNRLVILTIRHPARRRFGR